MPNQNMPNQKKLDARVAILATHGFEQSELLQPRQALQDAGAETHVISIEKGEIKGWNHGQWGEAVHVDRTLKDARPRADEYDALLLPGGVMNPDKLRMNSDAVAFAKHFFDEGKPIAAICHGPQLLIECDVLKGRTLTSYPSLRTDLKNAGAKWVDKEVVVDQGLVTSRTPDDIPAFNKKMIEEIHEGIHQRQKST